MARSDTRGRIGLFLACLGLSWFCGLCPAAAAPRFTTARAEKAVVIGGSISRFYAGSFGQFLQYACRDLEVVNLGEVGAGAAKMRRNFQTGVLDRDTGLIRHMPDGHRWLLVQGGLNSVWLPEATSWTLSRLFLDAHDAGFGVVALSLSPWGDDSDPRFDGWKGLRMHRATEHVVDFVMGRLKPAAAFGARAAGRPDNPPDWLTGELPAVAVDLWASELRAGPTVPLRPAEPLRDSFATSHYRKRVDAKDDLVAAARAIGRQFLAKKYQSFDATHPNTAGHKLMAMLTCQKAPAAWSCDCDALRRGEWRAGKVQAPK
ncbi:MAG: hypothetical protein FJ100_14530 [Deltaproteobacteria bacterium]|nr:hypothetical protein [Deltaproteobacteria bacterium]